MAKIKQILIRKKQFQDFSKKELIDVVFSKESEFLEIENINEIRKEIELFLKEKYKLNVAIEIIFSE